MSPQRFDSKGMMVIPDPANYQEPHPAKVLIVKNLYCPNGHELVTRQASFNGNPGILLNINQGNNNGFVALSPFYGKKDRVSIGLELETGELLEISCPECTDTLPVHSPCHCGGSMIALFNTPEGNFADCIGICNRVDCANSEITSNGELISLAMIDSM